MIKVVVNGVVVSVVLDMRTINKEGTYPVKIKVYYQCRPKYYSTGICLASKAELEEILKSKSREYRDIQDAIGRKLGGILENVKYLTDRGTFSFDSLNNRLGKNIGGSINEMFEAKINELNKAENTVPQRYIGVLFRSSNVSRRTTRCRYVTSQLSG